MTTVKEAVKTLYKQIYLKYWSGYVAEWYYSVYGGPNGPVLYYNGVCANIPATQKTFIEGLGFNLKDVRHEFSGNYVNLCHIQYENRDLTCEELYFDNMRYLAEVSGYDIRDCPLPWDGVPYSMGWGFFGKTDSEASANLESFRRKLWFSCGTRKVMLKDEGWLYYLVSISSHLFNIGAEIPTPKFIPGSNYINWNGQSLYPENTADIPVGKKVRAVAKIKNEGPKGGVLWQAGYWEGGVWKCFSDCKQAATGFASGCEITFDCDFRMPDKDIDLIFAAYGMNPLKDPPKNNYLCTDTLTFYLKKVTLAPTVVFDVYEGKTKTWIFPIDVDYYWVVCPGEIGWDLKGHVLRVSTEMINKGPPSTVRLQAWNLTDKKEICHQEKYLETDEAKGFQCGEFTITKDINAELRALYQDATGKWIISARTDTFYLRIGPKPPCEEGVHEVLEYCPDGVTEKRWRDCISGVWVENSRICPAPPECEEGAHEVLEYCPDGITEKRWRDCVSGKWVEKSRVCPIPPECTEGAHEVLEYCPDGVTEKRWRDCVSGKWVENSRICPTTCSDGERVCKGYDLYECKDGAYVLIERNSAECGYVPPKPVCPILEAFGFACVIHPDLVTLRAFRDAVLPRIVVKAYYAVGPLMILLFVNNRASKWFVRKMVHIVAQRLRKI